MEVELAIALDHIKTCHKIIDEVTEQLAGTVAMKTYSPTQKITVAALLSAVHVRFATMENGLKRIIKARDEGDLERLNAEINSMRSAIDFGTYFSGV